MPWGGTKTLTAAPSSPRCFVHRTRFGDDASRREASLGSLSEGAVTKWLRELFILYLNCPTLIIHQSVFLFNYAKSVILHSKTDVLHFILNCEWRFNKVKVSCASARQFCKGDDSGWITIQYSLRLRRKVAIISLTERAKTNEGVTKNLSVTATMLVTVPPLLSGEANRWSSELVLRLSWKVIPLLGEMSAKQTKGCLFLEEKLSEGLRGQKT